MTLEGARGATASEMSAVLHVKSAATLGALQRVLVVPQEPNAPELSIANRLWPHQRAKLEADFLAKVTAAYGAGLSPLDYGSSPEGARRTINGWVAKETRDKIVDLLPQGSIDAGTRLVLTNAVYFKGKWVSTFDPSATAPGPFHLASGATKSVPMMHRKLRCGLGTYAGAKVVELAYASGASPTAPKLVMDVVVPSSPTALPAVEAAFVKDGASAFTAALRPGTEVVLSLPKFRTTATFELAGPLSAMGMPSAFGPQADFRGISTTEPLQITRALHKAFVDVNEQGTEAAAATAVVVGITSVAMPPEVVEVDRPFLFFIRDAKSGAVLFVGRIGDPTA
jgi:serpin B